MDPHHWRRASLVLLTAAAATLALAACAAMAPGAAGPDDPQLARPWRLEGQAMISAADPRAVEAGLDALRHIIRYNYEILLRIPRATSSVT
jgi:hypothetical protein